VAENLLVRLHYKLNSKRHWNFIVSMFKISEQFQHFLGLGHPSFFQTIPVNSLGD